MPLPPQAIEEFRAIWKVRTSADLTDTEAAARANEFMGLVRLVTRRLRDMDALESGEEATPVDKGC